MTRSFFSSSEPITLVGGGALSLETYQICRSFAEPVVGADGGANFVFEQGELPDAVIGDLDSLAPGFRDRLPVERLLEISEQDSTDFDKALRSVEAPLILAPGFMGKRVDHELAAFHGLTVRSDRAVILVGETSLVCVVPPELQLDLPKDTALSLFPMGEVKVASEGLAWPTTGLSFAPHRQIGTSNAVEGPVVLRPDAPLMLLILDQAHLKTLMAALLASARWPALAKSE
ncbi:MAG: thiamine diphosphokinase [Pseudomonadota bacterium]